MATVDEFKKASRVIIDNIKKLKSEENGLNISIKRQTHIKDRLEKEIIVKNTEIIKINKSIHDNGEMLNMIEGDVNDTKEDAIKEIEYKKKCLEREVLSERAIINQKVADQEQEYNKFKEEKVKFHFDRKELDKNISRYDTDKEDLNKDLNNVVEKQRVIRDKEDNLLQREHGIVKGEKRIENLVRDKENMLKGIKEVDDKCRLKLEDLEIKMTKVNKLQSRQEIKEKELNKKAYLLVSKEEDLRKKELRLEDREKTLQSNLSR